jgi:hypothetical protein
LLCLFSFLSSFARQQQSDDMPLPARQVVDTSAGVAVAVAEVVLLLLPDSPPVLVAEVFFGHQRSHIIVPSSLGVLVYIWEN